MAIAFRASSTAASSATTALIVNKPSGLLQNDVLIAFCTTNTGTNPFTAPSGWTLVSGASGTWKSGVYYAATYRKVATSSEPSTYTFSLSSTQACKVGIVAYSGVSTSTPIDVTALTTGSSATPTVPAVTTTGANEVVIGAYIADSGAGTITPTAGMTAELQTTSSYSMTLADIAAATAGTYGSYAGSAVSKPWIGLTVTLLPAATTAHRTVTPTALGLQATLARVVTPTALQLSASNVVRTMAPATVALGTPSIRTVTTTAALSGLAVKRTITATAALQALPHFRSATTAADSSGSATSLSVPAPSGLHRQDVLIALVLLDSTSVTPTAPAGWTLFANEPVYTGTVYYYVKAAGSGEPASYTFTWSGGNRVRITLAAYVNIDNSHPIQAVKSTPWTYSSQPTDPAITTTHDTSLIVLLHTVWNISAPVTITAPGGVTTEFNIVAAAWSAMLLADVLGTLAGTYGPYLASTAAAHSWTTTTVALQTAANTRFESVPATASLAAPLITSTRTVTATVSLAVARTVHATAALLAPLTRTITPAAIGFQASDQSRAMTATAALVQQRDTPATIALSPPDVPIAVFRAASSADDLTGTAQSLTIPAPVGVRQGDALIAFVLIQSQSLVPATPFTWTLLASVAIGTDATLYTYWTVASNAEPFSYTWLWGPGMAWAGGGIVAYAGSDAASPVNVSVLHAGGSDAAPVAAAVTTTHDSVRLLTLAVAKDVTTLGSVITPDARLATTASIPSDGWFAALFADVTAPAAGTYGPYTDSTLTNHLWGVLTLGLKALPRTTTRSILSTAALEGLDQSRTIPQTAALLTTTTRNILATVATIAQPPRVLTVTAALACVGLTRNIPASAATTHTGTRTTLASVSLVHLRTITPATAALRTTGTRTIPAQAALLGPRKIAATVALKSLSLVHTLPAAASLSLPPTLYTVLISGAPVTVDAGSINIQDTLGQRSTATFIVNDYAGTLHFQEGQSVSIQDNFTRFFPFTGFILTAQESHPGRVSARQHAIQCMDSHYLADKRYIATSYANMTAGAIVRDILTNYLVPEGVQVSTANIQDGPVIVASSFNYVTIAAALDSLAVKAGFWWTIDAQRVLWFAGTATVPAPFPLTSAIIDKDQAPVVDVATPLYRNRQILTGVLATTSQQTETQHGDGQARAFIVSYPVNAVPTILVNAVPKNVGIQGLDTGKDWYWSKGSASITQDSAGIALLATDTLTVIYVGQYNAVVTLDDVHAQTLRKITEGGTTTGIVEQVTQAPSINSLAEGQQYAAGLLAKYAQAGLAVTAEIRKAGLASGQLLQVIIPEHDINAAMLVESVNAYDNGTEMRYIVKALQGPFDSSWEAFFVKLANPPNTIDMLSVGSGTNPVIVPANFTATIFALTASFTYAYSVTVCLFPSLTLFPSATSWPC